MTFYSSLSRVYEALRSLVRFDPKFCNLYSAKVCRREDVCHLIREGETQIAVRRFAIRQQAFGEDDIAVKAGIQKRL